MSAVAFGLAALLFAELTHAFQWLYRKAVPWPLLRPAAGGLLVIGLTYAVGTRDYLGLGVTADPASPTGVCLVSAFHPGGATAWSWWWKTLFTAATVGAGFKGGEVTPLFFIGAALGNALAGVLGAPPELFAGLGMVAIFAGASNTPLASALMGIELFGIGYALPIALACGVAFLCSGHAGIYRSQQFAVKKPFWRRPD